MKRQELRQVESSLKTSQNLKSLSSHWIVMVPINKCEKQGHQRAVLEKIIVTNYEKIAQLFI